MAVERFVRQDREIAAMITQNFGIRYEDRTYVLSKMLAGRYRVFSPPLESYDEHYARMMAEAKAGRHIDTEIARDQPYFSNVWKGSKYSGEIESYWYADIREGSTGDFKRPAGMHKTMDEAIQEVISILNGM